MNRAFLLQSRLLLVRDGTRSTSAVFRINSSRTTGSQPFHLLRIASLSSSSSSNAVSTPEALDVRRLASQVGVRLTPNELVLLRKKFFANPQRPQSQIQVRGKQALETKATRELCLSVICSAENDLDRWGVKVINGFDYLGTALFSVVGCQVAGDCGMNIVGCCLVGCVAAMGGGTLNSVMYGGASTLLAKSSGVRWVANPSYLIVALAAAALTFWAWPYYCQTQADHWIHNVIGHDQLEADGTIGRQAFLRAWRSDANFQQTIREALPRATLIKKPSKDQQTNVNNKDLMNEDDQGDGNLYFDKIDIDSSGDIDMDELIQLVQRRFYNGWETYWLDTFALSSLSIAGVTAAIRLGLPPIVSATSGVTVCFGGIFRDLLCGRDLAIGSQSYAFCTGASSTMYIALRELAIRQIVVLPLVVRTFAAFGTCVGLRGLEFILGHPLLSPMHGRKELQSPSAPARPPTS